MKIILKLLAVIFVTLPLEMNAGRDENSSQSSGNDPYITTLTKLKGKENQFEFDSGKKRSLLERDSGRTPKFYRVDRSSFNFGQGIEQVSGLASDKRFTSTIRETDEGECLGEMLTQDPNATCLVNIVNANDGTQLVVHKVTDRTTWGIELPVKIAE